MSTEIKPIAQCKPPRKRHGWRGQLKCWACGTTRTIASPVLHPKKTMSTENETTPMDSPSLSNTMREVVEQMRISDGEIHREPGGFWRIKGVDVKWWGTSTVEALVKRGVLEYCEHRQRRSSRGSFPVRARIAPNQPSVNTAQMPERTEGEA